MKIARRLGLALAPAALLGLYASFPMFAWLPWLALIPWVLLYTDTREPRASYLYFALGAYVAWILQYPQAWRFGWYAPFVMGLVCLAPWLPFAPLLTWLHRDVRLPRALATAMAWTTVEWFRVTFTVSHFDLYGLGYSQAPFPMLVQITDLTGVYGVSFLIAAVNGWLADGTVAVRELGWKRAFTRPTVSWSAFALVGVLTLVSGYGTWRLASIGHEPGPTLALVQPNLPHSKHNLVQVHLEQLRMTAQWVPAREADLVVWPENAILDNIRRQKTYLDDVAWLAREKEAWFLVGALGERQEHPGYTTNGAWLIDTGGTIRGSYQKQVLFPWSEYIPGDRFLGRWLPGVQRFHRSITRMGWGHQPSGTAGERTEVLELPSASGTVRFAPLICVENTYPPLPAEAGRLGADFFLNITSEGLVGGPVQEQLLRIAMLRAIENRMAYVRLGNTGISGVIDATGRVVAVLKGENGNTINTAGSLLAEVPLARLPATFYARSQDLFVKLVVGATLLLPALCWVGLGRSLRRAAPVVSLVLLVAGCASPPALNGSAERVSEYVARGRALLAEGKPGDAVDPLAAACVTETGCRESLPFLYEAFARGKSDDVAAITFREIAHRYPSLSPEALVARGFFLERILDLREARDAYLESLAREPSVAAYERLGRLEVRMDHVEDAVRSFRAGLRIEPGNPQLRYLLGRTLFFAGDTREAERILLELVGDAPDHAHAWTVLAWIRLEEEDESGARSFLASATRHDPAASEARYLLAKLALRRGDWEALANESEQLRAAR